MQRLAGRPPRCWQSYHGRRYPPGPVTYPWGGVASLKRGLMLQKLLAAHKAGQLQFFGQHTHLAERKAFAACWRRRATSKPTTAPSRGIFGLGLFVT